MSDSISSSRFDGDHLITGLKTDAGVNPSAAHLGKSQPTPADQEQAPLILSYTHTAGYPTSLYDTVTHTLTWLATKLGFDVNMYSSGFQKSTPPVQIAGVCVSMY